MLDRIFEAFKKNQYYGLTDLVSITKQPQVSYKNNDVDIQETPLNQSISIYLDIFRIS